MTPAASAQGAQRPFFDASPVGLVRPASADADTAIRAPLAFYNEIDPCAAAWLRNLIAAGHIAPGVVDERSIEDIAPEELHAFNQCHFFAGVGVWSLALRRAGWPDDRPVWTGSCPCQPFSAAGAGAGFVDERHLWPAFFHLIEQCRPAVVFGEQVASKDADPWIDLVCADLEAVGYAVGAVPFPSAGVGAPHIRDRLYWVADTNHARLEGRSQWLGECADERAARSRRAVGGLAHADHERLVRVDTLLLGQEPGRHQQDRVEAAGRSEAGGVADTDGRNAIAQRQQRSGQHGQQPQDGGAGEGKPGAVNGHWRAADWVLCRPEPGFPDGRWRPVEPGTFPLAHGAAARVGRLRAYGNAINAVQAQVFVEAFLAGGRPDLIVLEGAEDLV